jgi:hypothetical protein
VGDDNGREPKVRNAELACLPALALVSVNLSALTAMKIVAVLVCVALATALGKSPRSLRAVPLNACFPILQASP